MHVPAWALGLEVRHSFLFASPGKSPGFWLAIPIPVTTKDQK